MTSSKIRRSWVNCERHWGFKRLATAPNNNQRTLFGSKKKGITNYEERKHSTENRPNSPASRSHHLRCGGRWGYGDERVAFCCRRNGRFLGPARRGPACCQGSQICAD